MTPSAHIDTLELKLRQLAAKLERQRADHAAMRAENEQLKQELDRREGVVSALKDKLERDRDDRPPEREDKETIEFCLREIDRCLDFLARTN